MQAQLGREPGTAQDATGRLCLRMQFQLPEELQEENAKERE